MWVDFPPILKRRKSAVLCNLYRVPCNESDLSTQTFKEGKVQLTRSLLTQRVIYNLSRVSATHALQPTIGNNALGGLITHTARLSISSKIFLGGFSTHIARYVWVWTLRGKGCSIELTMLMSHLPVLNVGRLVVVDEQRELHDVTSTKHALHIGLHVLEKKLK
jgi:hypothetical protein